MAPRRRFDLKAILADPDLRRKLMVPTIQATQQREGVDTSPEQAERAYYVVSEGERAACFDLERFKGDRNTEDRREAMFVAALRGEAEEIRFDVPRRDFASVEGAPLTFQKLAMVAHAFRTAPPLDPAVARAAQGLATADDDRFVRCWWELPRERVGQGLDWVPFAKGGDFSRFYSDIYLVVLWRDDGHAIRNFEGAYIRNEHSYFKPGLTWPLRTQKGFNLRVLPEGCIFGHKGPGIFPNDEASTFYLLGLCNSEPAEYMLRALTSFGSWEVGVIKRLPVPAARSEAVETIADAARVIYEAKRNWDGGNEPCTHFTLPWVLRPDLVDDRASLPERLDTLLDFEASEDAHIQRLYAQINAEAYRLYGIPERSQARIVAALQPRPVEIVWPEMEGRSREQKRMEHVWRLLAHTARRVLATDDDGIVPLIDRAGEVSLLDRVLAEIEQLFPRRPAGQVEAEIANELKREVPGYRRATSIADWLRDAFFEHHVALHEGQPVVWHISSSQGRGRESFGVLVDYLRFNRDRMAKLRGGYVRTAIDTFRREAALATKEARTDEAFDWATKAEEAAALDARLQLVQEGHHEGPEDGERDYRILTPWRQPDERPRGWDPDLDDGVIVNIAPLLKAGVLRSNRGL